MLGSAACKVIGAALSAVLGEELTYGAAAPAWSLGTTAASGNAARDAAAGTGACPGLPSPGKYQRIAFIFCQRSLETL